MQSSPGPRLALEDELLVVMPLWLCSRPLLLPTPLPGASKASQRSNTPSHDGAFIGQALWYLSCMCPELLQPPGLSAQCCLLRPRHVCAEPGQYQVDALVLSSLSESSSLSRMSTKECPPPILPPLPHLSLASRPISSQGMFVTLGNHLQCHTKTLYFAHGKQCLALFMVFDAVNENKYGSL